MKRLGVNIDHVATLRNARGEIHPDPVKAAKFIKLLGANSITIHLREFKRIKKCSILANNLGIEVHAGHGLDYKTTKILSKIKEIKEFNIGHYLIGESIFYGLSKVIKNFKKIIRK